MESFELISVAVIETLKEFSRDRRALDVKNLCSVLSAKEDLSFLISNARDIPSCDESQSFPISRKELPHIPLNSGEISSSLEKIRDPLLNILGGLGAVLNESYIQRASELQQNISACRSIEHLAALGNELADFVKLISGNAVKQIDYASDFLAELSTDLSGMEEQLGSYQDYNRETYLLNDEFHNNLLIDAEGINEAFEGKKSLEDTRGVIASKIYIIEKAIEVRRKEDEIRLEAADTKITELQNSLKIYNEEINQVKERANMLEKEVLLDPLTEVHNRRAYDLQIRETFRRYQREGLPFSLILIDVDRFKRVNDKYGHSAGDKCLKELAKIIKDSLRQSDFVARYGGEEFVAILQGSSAEDTLRVAEKVRVRIEKACFCYQGGEIPVTISLGVTEVKATDEEPVGPFVRVDEAMYRAKKEGRNRVCWS